MEREVQRLIDAYQAEVIDLSDLQKRRKLINENSLALRLRSEEIKQNRMDREKEIRLLQGAEEFCESIRKAMVDPSDETKRKILQLVVDRIIVSKDNIIIRHIIPTKKFRLQTEPHVMEWTHRFTC